MRKKFWLADCSDAEQAQIEETRAKVHGYVRELARAVPTTVLIATVAEALGELGLHILAQSPRPDTIDALDELLRIVRDRWTVAVTSEPGTSVH